VLFEHQLDEETMYENVDRAGKVLGGVLYKIIKERKTSDARGQSALTEKLSGAALFVWNSLARIIPSSEANRKFQ
jgi:hypothetical protein